MKAILTLELFGEDTREIFKLYRGIFDVCNAKLFSDKYIGVPPRSSWVAEITGPDEKYRLKREFLKPKLDYSRSNGKGSRGIFAEYILESGKIYEVLSRENWRRSRRYFCKVTPDGDILEIPEEDACHSVGAETFEERRERHRAERVSGH